MKSLLITLFVLFIAVGLSAATQLIDFNDTSDLEHYFNPGWEISFTNINDGGLNDTGSVDIPPLSEDIWTHKTGFAVPAEGQTATVSAHFRIGDDFGYSGIGFAQANENFHHLGQIIESSSLGMRFTDGYGDIFNDLDSYNLDWGPHIGNLVGGNWYKVIFIAHNLGDDVFDLEFQIWNSDAYGTLGTHFVTHSQAGLSNPNMAGASIVYPYFFNYRYRSDRLDNFYVEITEPAPLDVVINTFPHTESFEGDVFPPEGWVLDPRYWSPNLELMTNDPLNPTVYDTPHGDNWVRLQSDNATLWSPRIDFPVGQDGNRFYKLTMSRFVTNNYLYGSNPYVLISLYPALDEPSSFRGAVANVDENEFAGWHDFSVGLGLVGGTSQYVSFNVYADSEAFDFDTLVIEEASLWSNPSPVDGATNVNDFPSFSWSSYWSIDNIYSLYYSTDNENFSLGYQERNPSGNLFINLEYETTYFWYVVAEENGIAVTSPTWSFTTEEGEPEFSTEIFYDFPYLADFQVEDDLWVSIIVSKNASSGKQLTPELGKNTLLQKHSSKNGRYEDGHWVRTLDGAANYAWKLSGGLVSGLVGPLFHLTAGQTYEIKYNHRQSALSESTEMEALFLITMRAGEGESEFLDVNEEVSGMDYALRMITFTPAFTDDYRFLIGGVTSVDMYVDNFRITQNGDDVLTAAAPTVDGVSTPNPAPIFNAETGQPLDTDLHVANIAGSPEITATVSWAVPETGSQNTGLKLNLNASEGSLAGAVVTFFHNLGYVPSSISYRIVPNAFAPLYNPNNGSWNASQCVFTVPAGKADGDFEVILGLAEDQTLPVELSSFTAIATQQNYVQLDWVTQSETGLTGYFIYRSSSNSLETAQIVSNLISAHNTSQQQAYSFTDREVELGSWYYWLQNMEMDGQMGFSSSIFIELQEGGHNGSPNIPLVTCIQNIYPNPFNPSTTIAFGLAKSEHVNIQIYNVRGQLVRNLLSETKAADTYRIVWNGTNDGGMPLPSGLYFARMTAGTYTTTRKLVIMK